MTITSVGYDGTVSDTQFAQLAQHIGARVPVVCGRTDFAVAINGAGTLTCTVAAGSAAAPGVLTTSDAVASVTFDAVTTTGQTRWDAVVIRYDWSAGTTTLVVVKGTASVGASPTVPSGVDLVMDSGLDQLLALVQLTYGSAVPTAVVDRRLLASKQFTAPALSALPSPSNALYGVEVVLATGEQYKCLLAGSTPAWVRQDVPTVATTGFYSPSPGWTIDAGSCRYLLDPNGIDVQYTIVARRTGAALRFGADGTIGDAPVATLTGIRPLGDVGIPVQFQSIGGATATGTQGVACWGYLGDGGGLGIESGIPNNYIKQQTVVGTWSVRAVINFRRF